MCKCLKSFVVNKLSRVVKVSGCINATEKVGSNLCSLLMPDTSPQLHFNEKNPEYEHPALTAHYTLFIPCNSQDLIVNSSLLLLNISLYVTCKNLVLYQDTCTCHNPDAITLITSDIFITCLLDNVTR